MLRKAIVVLLLALLATSGVWAEGFKAGFAKRDITPKAPMPMWGYGARHGSPAKSAATPLYAKALVIEAGGTRAAFVGLDLGRSPTYRSVDAIQAAVKQQSNVEFVMMSGSHTHHGPALELKNEPGKGQGRYDAGVAYATELEQNIIAAINEAAGAVVDAKIGWGSTETDLNRNRHSKVQPKPRDPELAVVRVDDLQGKPLAILVNLGAHATIASIMDYRWNAEWPGAMQHAVEEAAGTNCMFMQGAEGDMSPNTNDERRGVEGFGKAVAAKVLEINQGIQTRVPEHPGVKGVYDTFSCEGRIDLNDKLVQGVFKQGFFPEMIAFLDDFPNGVITARLVTVVLNGQLALVGGSGELFSDLSNRLKKSSKAEKTLLFGCCNGHCMYIPTERAVEEGGYGADRGFAWVQPETGREMMDKAAANIQALLGQ